MQVAMQALQNNTQCFKPVTMTTQFNNDELAQLLEQIGSTRDKQAFTVLFGFFAPKILGISKNRFANADQANEVLQETMSNVWRKAHFFDAAKGKATTWVYTIMRNVTFDMLRKIKSNKEDNLSDDIWPMVEEPQINTDIFDDHLAKQKIKDSLDALPENQQLVVKGFYFQQMSQEQLAKHLDLPLGTVKSRLRLALAKLKAQLGDEHD
jgi:RNA polymerase sigma-70 factor (ECF subfamily)